MTSDIDYYRTVFVDWSRPERKEYFLPLQMLLLSMLIEVNT